jgi:hypothetical protein
MPWWNGLYHTVTGFKRPQKHIYAGTITVKRKGKVVLVFNQFSTTPWRRMGEWRYSSTIHMTSAPDGGEWPASCPSCFTPKESAPGTHWIGGWVGPRADLDAVEKRIILPLLRIKPQPSSPQLVAIPTELSQLWDNYGYYWKPWDLPKRCTGHKMCFSSLQLQTETFFCPNTHLPDYTPDIIVV